MTYDSSLRVSHIFDERLIKKNAASICERDVTEINESGARERMSMRGGRVEDIKNFQSLRRCHFLFYL